MSSHDTHDTCSIFFYEWMSKSNESKVWWPWNKTYVLDNAKQIMNTTLFRYDTMLTTGKGNLQTLIEKFKFNMNTTDCDDHEIHGIWEQFKDRLNKE